MSFGVAVTAAFLAGMGALALVRPAAVVGIFHIRADAAESRNEVRAVYGGFGLAVATMLVIAGRRSDAFGDGLAIAVAVALAGMAAGRLAGFLVERPRSFYPTVFFLFVEAALACVLVLSV